MKNLKQKGSNSFMEKTQQKISHRVGEQEQEQRQDNKVLENESHCHRQPHEQSQSMNQNNQHTPKHNFKQSSRRSQSSSLKPKTKCGSTSIILIFITAMLFINSFIIVGSNYLFSRDKTQLQRKENEAHPASVSSVAPTPDINTTAIPSSLDILTEGWVNFDFPKFVYQFAYNDFEEIVISFDSIITSSTQANYVKFVVLQKSANEPGWNEFFTRVRAVNGKNVFVHWLHNIAANAGYSTAQTFIIPTSQSRQIRIKGYNKRVSNMYAKFYITAYHP